MTYQQEAISDDLGILLRMLSHVTSGCAETPENVAFLSGAALGHLRLVPSREEVPQAEVANVTKVFDFGLAGFD